MKRLKKLRLEEGLTQVELADEVNLRQSVVSVLERGYRKENESGFRRLCDYFDIDVEKALEDIDHGEKTTRES